MAHVRDSDTSLWLHNKLGTSNDLWSGGSICSQLNQDVLRNIRECFIELQSQVKLKLLLSFLHIPRRNVDEWQVELEEILEVALVDSDQWVSMLAELLKTYCSTGMLNFKIEENTTVFIDLITELKKLVRKHSDQAILPMECLYLNRSALTAVVGQPLQLLKHFALKRKPKSAALRAELLLKSSEAASNIKKMPLTPSVPIRCRGLSKNLLDATPLKGIPSRVPSGGFRPAQSGINRLGAAPPLGRTLSRPPAGRKDGGIKLLDINEQPIGYGRDAKRRKKQPENETAEQRKEKDPNQPLTMANPSTPDYAAGLLSSSSQLSASVIGTSTNNTYLPPISLSTSGGPSATGNATPATNQARENFQQTLQSMNTQLQVSPPSQEPARVQQPQASASVTARTATIGSLASMGGMTVQVHIPGSQTQQVGQPQPQAPPQSAVLQQQSQKKNLSLSKEQMLEAQEMFNNSNKVTRPEKALILGFMAGSRENPCPHLGSIVTIKLSENEETIVQTNGTLQTFIVETHFQMNYSTGEWKRVKKFQKLDE
ncbi:negative elongation factor A-like isoform X1 [Limulus polyphemus]|uniref:Negative elongation factor A-like isoform X1 n=2 Tax=Limulus polyphemus TaxID=6850 RepID=A0ABM1BXS2_LIMPO|nr:negative elongation factor A-like isoform X1 [Limulus polyphemus]